MASVRCCLILFFLILTIFKIATSEKNVCHSNFTASFVTSDCEGSGRGTQYVSSVTSNTTGVNLFIQFPCNSSQTWCYFVKAPDNINSENPPKICWWYECLPANRHELNLCEDKSTTADKLYLASPQFFTRQTPNTTNACHCRMTTSSPAHIRPLYVTDANGLNVTAGASPVTLSTKDNSTACVEGTVDIVVNQSNPVWLEMTGQNLSLKCNGEMETNITSETKSGLCSDFTTIPGPMETGERTPEKKNTVVYIISVVGGVVVLVCGVVIAVIIRRWRRRGQAKEDIQVMCAVSPVTAETDSVCPNLTSLSRKPVDPGYSEVVLVDDGKTEKEPFKSIIDCLQDGQSTSVIEKTTHAGTNGRSPHAGQTIPMSTIQQQQNAQINDESAASQCAKATAPTSAAVGPRTAVRGPTTAHSGPIAFSALGPERPRQNDADNKNLYFILEPEHKTTNDSTSVKQTSDAVEKKSAEDFADESFHYYSVIKDNGEAPTTAIPTAAKAASAARTEVTPYGVGEYEVIDLISDENAKNDVKGKSGPQSSGPHRRGSGLHNTVSSRRQRFTFLRTPKPCPKDVGNDCNDDGDDELVMIDNVAFVSAEPGPKDDCNYDNDDGDDDELVMIDNVAYASAEPGPKDAGNDDNDDGDDDDELVMIDNVAYVSVEPPSASIRPASPDHGERENIEQDSVENDDDECIMVDNVAYVSAGPRNDRYETT